MENNIKMTTFSSTELPKSLFSFKYVWLCEQIDNLFTFHLGQIYSAKLATLLKIDKSVKVPDIITFRWWGQQL